MISYKLVDFSVLGPKRVSVWLSRLPGYSQNYVHRNLSDFKKTNQLYSGHMKWSRKTET